MTKTMIILKEAPFLFAAFAAIQYHHKLPSSGSRILATLPLAVPHGIMFINEFIIRMLNPLVVVDFRFICIPACIMSSEFTLEREQWNFYLLMIRFLEFYVNVFKAILSIQRFFNLTEYREVSLKNHCSLCICERRQIWNTGVNLIKHLQV